MPELILSFGDIVTIDGEKDRRDVVLRLGQDSASTTEIFTHTDGLPYCKIANVGGIPFQILHPTGERLTTVEIQTAFRRGLQIHGEIEGDLDQIERLPQIFPEVTKTFSW